MLCKVILGRGQPGLTNEINFVMNHATDAGSITGPVDQQSSVLPLSYGCSPTLTMILKHCYHGYLTLGNSATRQIRGLTHTWLDDILISPWPQVFDSRVQVKGEGS